MSMCILIEKLTIIYTSYNSLFNFGFLYILCYKIRNGLEPKLIESADYSGLKTI